MPGREELPSTLERSSDKAQRTWIKAHDSAVETYGEGERAHRLARAVARKGGQRCTSARGAAKPEEPAAGRPRGRLFLRS